MSEYEKLAVERDLISREDWDTRHPPVPRAAVDQIANTTLGEWRRHADYIVAHDRALTNAKNQALRVLALLDEVDRLRERVEQLEDWQMNELVSVQRAALEGLLFAHYGEHWRDVDSDNLTNDEYDPAHLIWVLTVADPA